jgi:hypothetical protein
VLDFNGAARPLPARKKEEDMTPLILTSLLAVAAADKPAAPKGPPPVIRLAQMTARGQLVIQTEVSVPKVVVEVRQVEAVIDGKLVKREVRVQRRVFETQVRREQLDVKGVKAEEVEGEKLDKKRLAKRLSKLTPVVLANKPLDPAYRRLFRKGTLVLVVPGVRLEVADPEPDDLPPEKPNNKPLTKEELKQWADYLKTLTDPKERKLAEADWKKARTNADKRELLLAARGPAEDLERLPPLPPRKFSNKPLTRAELKVWADHLKKLTDPRARKAAEDAWKKADTPAKKRKLLEDLEDDDE